MLEGVRRVGKSTIAETFAKNEYKSYIMLDFSKVADNIRNIFDDIGNLDLYFLRLEATTDRELFYHTWEKKDSTHYYEVVFLEKRYI